MWLLLVSTYQLLNGIITPRICIVFTDTSTSPLFLIAAAPHDTVLAGHPPVVEPVHVEFTHILRPWLEMAWVCPPVWKRLVPYNTTPVPKTTEATKIISVVITTLIAFLFFVLYGNISYYMIVGAALLSDLVCNFDLHIKGNHVRGKGDFE